MKKLLLFIVLLFFGIITNAQNLGMSAIEIRKTLESEGYDVTIINLDNGLKCLATIKEESVFFYYINKNNYPKTNVDLSYFHLDL